MGKRASAGGGSVSPNEAFLCAWVCACLGTLAIGVLWDHLDGTAQ